MYACNQICKLCITYMYPHTHVEVRALTTVCKLWVTYMYPHTNVEVRALQRALQLCDGTTDTSLA